MPTIVVKVGDRVRVITRNYGHSLAYGEIGTVTGVNNATNDGDVDINEDPAVTVDVQFDSGTERDWYLWEEEFELIAPEVPLTDDEKKSAIGMPTPEQLESFLGL